MTTIIKRNLFYVNGINDLQKTLFELFAKKNYKKIYVSIGSKWNESTYEYHEIYGNTKQRQTNSHLQLVPNFMKYRSDDVLLISCDLYHTIENRMENFKIVQNNLTENMDFIFYSILDNIESIQNLLQFLIEILEINSISPENFMIVNYIRFQRPNQFEIFSEKNNRELIKALLNNTIYKNCYYIWFGYQENLYNIIYNQNNYDFMFRFNEILCTLHTLLRSGLFGMNNVYYIYDYYKTQNNYLYFEIFLKNVVDISSFSNNENKIADSLMEYIEFS